MKFTIIPHCFENKWYFVSPISGNLVFRDDVADFTVNEKVKNAIYFCDNPYELIALPYFRDLFIYIDEFTQEKIDIMNERMLWFGNKRFLLSCLYSRFQTPFFKNTIDAFDYISQIKIHKEKKGKICLQRALLAAKTSKTFKKNGVLFIGAQLPTGLMHAWIIDNGVQPDRQDREWIMYKPLLAITF